MALYRDGGVRQKVVGCIGGELIAAFILLVAGVTFDPVPAYPVRFGGGQKPLPEVDIKDRISVRFLPSFLDPVFDPVIIKSFDHILGI